MAKFHLIYGIRNYWGTKCWNLTSRFSCQMTKSSQGKGKKPANWVIIYQSHPFQKSLSLKKTAWPLGPGIFGKFHPHPNLWYGFMNPHSLRYHRASQKKNTPGGLGLVWRSLAFQSKDWSPPFFLEGCHGSMARRKRELRCGCIYNWRYIIHLHEKSMCIYLICVLCLKVQLIYSYTYT